MIAAILAGKQVEAVAVCLLVYRVALAADGAVDPKATRALRGG